MEKSDVTQQQLLQEEEEQQEKEAESGPAVGRGTAIPHIGEDANRVLTLWFGGNLNENYAKWFTKGDSQARLDEQIRETFGGLLKEAEQGGLQEWKAHPESFVALILVLDQFSRHIYRGDKDKIKKNDEIALQYSTEFIKLGWHKQTTLSKHIFVLMPFRHSNDENHIKFVLSQLEEREKMTTDDVRLLDRFKKTSLRKLYDIPTLTKQVDESSRILEFYPFDADETDIYNNRLVRTMSDFLKDRYLPEHRYTAISLSGGVDSMVILKCLSVLAPLFGFKIIAIHIDYANRPESGLEAKFVEEWCKTKRLNNVKDGQSDSDELVIFRKRRIEEVTRGITDRDLYEKESRRIRFEFYRKVLDEFKTDTGICLGHHKGDEQENIITNIMKGRESILNLSGMAPESIINGVKIWRPFMPHPKSLIYEFSHKYGIPYFLDTTPKWSNRGKVRNNLQPLLSDIFGEGYLNNLSALGEDSKDLSELVNEVIFKPVWDSINRSEVAVWFNLRDHRTKPKLFWKEMMRYVFYSMGVSTVRDKSMAHFMKRLDEGFAPEGVWVSLKKENPSLFFEDDLIIFRQSFFPTPSPHFTNKTIIPDDNTTVLGPWHITLLRTKKKDMPNKEEELNIELTIRDILTGRFHYYLKGHDQFYIDSDSRPKAFRLIPKVITLTIPIVVGRSKDNKVDNDSLVKVALEFNNHEVREELMRLKIREEERAMCRPIKKHKGLKTKKERKLKINNNTEEADHEDKEEELLMDFN